METSNTIGRILSKPDVSTQVLSLQPSSQPREIRSISAGRSVCLWKLGGSRADTWSSTGICLASHDKLLLCHPQETSCDSLFPQKSITVANFSLLPSSRQAQGEQWESLEQAAPLVAESFLYPRHCPNLSQLFLLWLLLSRLLLCSCPTPQPKPCSHPQHLSFGA